MYFLVKLKEMNSKINRNIFRKIDKFNVKLYKLKINVKSCFQVNIDEDFYKFTKIIFA